MDPSATAAPLGNIGGISASPGSFTSVLTNTSSQIRYRVDQNVQTYIVTYGWEDSL
jgi:hypothetical protein